MDDRIGGQQQISAILKMFPCPRQQSWEKLSLLSPCLNSFPRIGKAQEP